MTFESSTSILQKGRTLTALNKLRRLKVCTSIESGYVKISMVLIQMGHERFRATQTLSAKVAVDLHFVGELSINTVI
jgi:hypothetical protein